MPLLLDGVSAGFIQGIHFDEIALDGHGVERMESDGGALNENLLAMLAAVEQAHARHHLVGAALQLFQHLIRLVKTRGLAEQLGAQIDQRVSPQHQRIGKLLGHRAGFAICVDLRHLARRQLLMMNLGHVAGRDLEFQTQLTQ